MANVQHEPIDVPGSTAAGDPFEVSRWERFTVYVIGLTGSWQVQISPDGDNWYNYGSSVTDAGFVECSAQAEFARVNVTYSSGTVSGLVWGQYSANGG